MDFTLIAIEYFDTTQVMGLIELEDKQVHFTTFITGNIYVDDRPAESHLKSDFNNDYDTFQAIVRNIVPGCVPFINRYPIENLKFDYLQRWCVANVLTNPNL